MNKGEDRNGGLSLEEVHLLNKSELRNGELSLKEVENAKLLCVKYEQSFIENSHNYEKLKNSLLLFSDNQHVLRCRSGLAKAKR